MIIHTANLFHGRVQRRISIVHLVACIFLCFYDVAIIIGTHSLPHTRSHFLGRAVFLFIESFHFSGHCIILRIKGTCTSTGSRSEHFHFLTVGIRHRDYATLSGIRISIRVSFLIRIQRSDCDLSSFPGIGICPHKAECAILV